MRRSSCGRSIYHTVHVSIGYAGQLRETYVACAHTSGEPGSGTALGLELRVKMSWEASSSARCVDVPLVAGLSEEAVFSMV